MGSPMWGPIDWKKTGAGSHSRRPDRMPNCRYYGQTLFHAAAMGSDSAPTG